MGSIISVHSFRGGTGKSNTTANLGCTLATLGYRVAIVDTDIQSPVSMCSLALSRKIRNMP